MDVALHLKDPKGEMVAGKPYIEESKVSSSSSWRKETLFSSMSLDLTGKGTRVLPQQYRHFEDYSSCPRTRKFLFIDVCKNGD